VVTPNSFAFEDSADELDIEPSADGGAFVLARWAEPRARSRFRLGRVPAMRRFVAAFRPEPFWMMPRVGERLSQVPADTQLLLSELDSERFLLVAPLVSAPFKVTLEGADDDALWLTLDTGEPSVLGREALSAYLAVGSDPYELCRRGARAVAARLGSVTLRVEKRLPGFVDYFGWCTWDAFYQDVSQAKLEQGLRCLREAGVAPGFVILDDGWQSVAPRANGASRLSALDANAKFPQGLAACVARAKNEHGVRAFLVWHTIHGYWGGVDEALLPGYEVSEVARRFSPEVLAHRPSANHEYWGPSVGRPSLSGLARFFDDYHSALAAAGVDGVKVDNQASVEALCQGQGGRVAAMLATRAALEASVERHFDGTLINCMSCSTEMLYAAKTSSLTRTSTDFWPKRPETHGVHVHTNALMGLWFGELIHPDWDMFQSTHAAGAFHAAARAVSGSAVYVSDEPGQHDLALLRELTCSNGRVLRAEGVAVPTLDCLFSDPTSELSLFKIWNRNLHNAVVGIFNAQGEGGPTLRGGVSPSDVPQLQGEFALYLKRRDALLRVAASDVTWLELLPLSAEVATFAAIEQGLAVLGLCDKLNGGAAVRGITRHGDACDIQLCDGGRLLLFCEHEPAALMSDGEAVSFTWLDHRLEAELPKAGAQLVQVVLASR
jgi:raffinose synthase